MTTPPESALSQTEQQQRMHRVYAKQHTYFGDIVSRYLIRRFRRQMRFPLLDAGAGKGSFITALKEEFPDRAAEIHGIDIVGQPELNIVEGSLSALPAADHSLKTIICSEVLEHLDDETLDQALAEFRRTLTPDGIALCTFPYDEVLERSIVHCPHCNHSFHQIGHVRSWHTPAVVRELFTSRGFTIQFMEILPLGAVAKLPFLRLLTPLLNRLDNPSGFKKRVVIIVRPC